MPIDPNTRTAGSAGSNNNSLNSSLGTCSIPIGNDISILLTTDQNGVINLPPILPSQRKQNNGRRKKIRKNNQLTRRKK